MKASVFYRIKKDVTCLLHVFVFDVSCLKRVLDEFKCGPGRGLAIVKTHFPSKDTTAISDPGESGAPHPRVTKD
jgi:hypothetical protein